MELLIAILWMLFYAGLVAVAIYLVIWFLETIIGMSLPPRVIQILWALFAILVIIMLLQILLGATGGFNFPTFKGH